MPRWLASIAMCIFIVGCGDLQKTEPLAQEQPLSKSEFEPELTMEALEANFKSAKQAYQAEKTNDQKRQTFIAAAVAYADALKDRPGIPKEKYPKALAIYRRVLEIDPRNERAMAGEQQIMGIYRQMNREPAKVKID